MWYDDPSELSKRRKAIGISQAELASRAGMSRSVLRDLEIGRTKFRGELRNALWKAIADFQIEAEREQERWKGLPVMNRYGVLAGLGRPENPKQYRAWK